jgi:hypothetical protein
MSDIFTLEHVKNLYKFLPVLEILKAELGKYPSIFNLHTTYFDGEEILGGFDLSIRNENYTILYTTKKSRKKLFLKMFNCKSVEFTDVKICKIKNFESEFAPWFKRLYENVIQLALEKKEEERADAGTDA